MSETAPKTETVKRRALRARIWQQVPLIVALVILWMLLWGSISWLNLVTGLVLAIVVTRVFFLPPIELSGRFHPWWALVFLADFSAKVVVASFQVAAQAFAARPVSRNAVIGVQLFTRSDLIMTLTAIALSLIPGSLVVEADRERSVLYLHVFSTPDDAAVEAARTQVMRIERQLVRALGSRHDLERMSEWT
jgi:multicomponent Na+:H+ antiporter subunit E